MEIRIQVDGVPLVLNFLNSLLLLINCKMLEIFILLVNN